MKRLLLLAVVAVLAYGALPYWSAYSLAQAIDRADAVALEPKIAWEDLRASLADDVEGVLANRVSQVAGNGPLGGLIAGALAPSLTEGALEATINPKTISTLVKRARQLQAEVDGAGGTGGDGDNTARPADIRYAFFDDLNTFRVSLAPKGTADTADLIFERRGLQWPLVRMNLPDGALSGLN